MSNMQGFDFQDDTYNGFLDLMTELIEQANNNYLKTLIASSQRDGDQVWQRYHEGFALDEDITTLATFHALSELSVPYRFRSSH
jgi:hypothetical protein